MTFQDIRYETSDGVCAITLHRPEKLNAVTRPMLDELITAFDQADDDDAVRVVIVTGAGRAFCAGADLSSGGHTFASPSETESIERRGLTPPSISPGERRGLTPPSISPGDDHRDAGGLVTLRLFDMKKPVIAAINGPAVGFGITMTLAMDIRIASSAARMGFVFTRRGVVPEACSTWFLPRIVGISRAAEWVYTGRVFGADEARDAGLVSRVVAPDTLLATARELAREIAQHTSAISVALSRQMLWRLLGADHPMDGHRLDSKCMAWTGRSADAYEGVTSFLEKRPPRFTLRPSQDMPPFYPWWESPPFKK